MPAGSSFYCVVVAEREREAEASCAGITCEERAVHTHSTTTT